MSTEKAVALKVLPSDIRGRRPQDILLLGAAPVLSDHTLWGTINKFRIWSGVFSESSARVSYQIGPDHISNRKSSLPLSLSFLPRLSSSSHPFT